mgnify:CR=1 FL=1
MALIGLIAEAAAARDDAIGLEEISLRLAAAAISGAAGSEQPSRLPTARDRSRIVDVIRCIETESGEPLTLAALARDAGMSPFHFLRCFRQVAGVTPHQFVLIRRLNAAADLLGRTNLPVAGIAYESGFGDLSTFNRRFRRVMGMAPTAYRRRWQAASSARR